MLSFRVDILVLACTDSAKEGPMVGWMRTVRHFGCLELLLSFFPLGCPEELCPLLLPFPPLLVGAPWEAIATLYKHTVNWRATRTLPSFFLDSSLWSVWCVVSFPPHKKPQPEIDSRNASGMRSRKWSISR